MAERATTAMAAGAGLTVGAAGVRAGGGSSPAVITPCGVGGRTSAAGRGGGSSMGNLVSSGGALPGSRAVASRILMRSGGAGAGSGSGAGIGGQGRQLTASGVSDGASAVDSPRLSQASVLSRSTPVLLHDLGPYGPPLPGLLKLVVTIKEVYEVSLYLTCCQCEDTRVGGSCRCTKARAANLHAEAKVGVTDGTGIATLVAKGRCLWAPASVLAGHDRLRARSRRGEWPAQLPQPESCRRWEARVPELRGRSVALWAGAEHFRRSPQGARRDVAVAGARVRRALRLPRSSGGARRALAGSASLQGDCPDAASPAGRGAIAPHARRDGPDAACGV